MKTSCTLGRKKKGGGGRGGKKPHVLLLLRHWEIYGSNFNIMDINTMDIFIYNTLSWTCRRNCLSPHSCKVFYFNNCN